MDISGIFFCSRCMRPMEDEEVCPYCGYDHRKEQNKNPALERGTLLHDRYQLGSMIGAGGFGMTYAAYDEVLQTPVAVKEFFPADYARRDTEESDEVFVTEEKRGLFRIGMEHFLREARVLGMMKNIRGVVTVQDYFEENETAYIVMEFIQGVTLGEYVKKKQIKPAELFEMLKDPIDALILLHKQGVLHRDITPSNLLVSADGSVKLIDFGSAAWMDREQSMIVVTKRYAPPEQYGTSNQAMGP
ncbi:MAG: serine/threonine protein kinase [Lachnospiraceae bacterium]|nr:serine/threonine protein kinase [Lachnospiraceae bacterium]